MITGQDGFALLLEVKHREADLIRGLERIQMGDLTNEGKGPAPDHNHDLLFRSVEEKFLSRPTGFGGRVKPKRWPDAPECANICDNLYLY